jgi:transketolase
MTVVFGPRRGVSIGVPAEAVPAADGFASGDAEAWEALDGIYRALCAILYNYVPTSGHPGGALSSGRIAQVLAFETLDYDVARPDREDADVLSYAAGHKAMGLYALWALRDEIMRLGAPELLSDLAGRLRLEDLLGFRRNPTHQSSAFRRARARTLDGHPTPATPFVRLATGASGVGVASSIGLAIALRDEFGADAPRVHVLEGEGGLTPGRVAEALAAAGSASLGNVVVHLDWNQSSIDSDHVCREADRPGDYVQWSPAELFHLHDWNVVEVADGMSFPSIVAAQRAAASLTSGQPTAIVYRTVKGFGYGIAGRASHGAGHALCSPGFHRAVADLARATSAPLPSCEGPRRCEDPRHGADALDECLSEALGVVRERLEEDRRLVDGFADRLLQARERLDARARRRRPSAPDVAQVYRTAGAPLPDPSPLALAPGSATTLRAELGRALAYLNQASGGALFVASADLLGSTSLELAGRGFPAGFWNAATNPLSRLLATGGICEDAMAGILSGISSSGLRIGVGSSYGAFLAALGHVAARLHGIGAQARAGAKGDAYRPMILVCAHAGLKTGEDGPTHADPQALQLLQGNFPDGVAVTLTPWEPGEIWPLLAAALAARPALIAPFVTRPPEPVLDRAAFGLAPAADARTGLYLLRRPGSRHDGTIVLQESAVAYTFVLEVLPRLASDGVAPAVFYVSSAELFDRLPAVERERLWPEWRAREAMGITGFTLPTMDRWIHSDLGRACTLHPFTRGHFLGSGAGAAVLAEAGLDGEGQYRVIRRYLDARRSAA